MLQARSVCRRRAAPVASAEGNARVNSKRNLSLLLEVALEIRPSTAGSFIVLRLFDEDPWRQDPAARLAFQRATIVVGPQNRSFEAYCVALATLHLRYLRGAHSPVVRPFLVLVEGSHVYESAATTL